MCVIAKLAHTFSVVQSPIQHTQINKSDKTSYTSCKLHVHHIIRNRWYTGTHTHTLNINMYFVEQSSHIPEPFGRTYYRRQAKRSTFEHTSMQICVHISYRFYSDSHRVCKHMCACLRLGYSTHARITRCERLLVTTRGSDKHVRPKKGTHVISCSKATHNADEKRAVLRVVAGWKEI